MVETLSAQLSLRESKANNSNTTYTNTLLLAENGTLEITSLNNAEIKGADLTAEDIIINTGNNLNIESLQNSTHNKSEASSISLEGSKSSNGGSSKGLSYNANREKFDRDWVDDQTEVIGTNSVIINTGNDLNLTSNQDITISASNLDSGNNLNITAETLNIQAGEEVHLKSYEEKIKRTLNFRNYNQDQTTTKIVNSELTAANDFNFNITNKAEVSYKTETDNNNDQIIPAYLTELRNQNSFLLTENLKENNRTSSNDAMRG